MTAEVLESIEQLKLEGRQLHPRHSREWVSRAWSETSAAFLADGQIVETGPAEKLIQFAPIPRLPGLSSKGFEILIRFPIRCISFGIRIGVGLPKLTSDSHARIGVKKSCHPG
jgi:hypothetical protein